MKEFEDIAFFSIIEMFTRVIKTIGKKSKPGKYLIYVIIPWKERFYEFVEKRVLQNKGISGREMEIELLLVFFWRPDSSFLFLVEMLQTKREDRFWYYQLY